MIKIESLKDYNNLSKEELIKLATKIYDIVDFISKDYPAHKNWYFNKQLPETIEGNNRNILFVRNPKNYDEIISMACLKSDDEEKKICTLYVSDKYRGLGIGTMLIEQSINWLGTAKPLVTIAEYKLEMFRPIIEKYNWELIEVVSNLYNASHKELCFNGILTKDNENLKKQLHNRLILSLNNRKKQLEEL